MAPRRSRRRGCESCRNLLPKNFKDVTKVNESCGCSHPAYNRKDRIHRVRTRNKKLNIPKLVYKFLGNVASLETEENNEEDSPKRSSPKRSGTRKSKKHQRHPDAVHVATKSVDESRTSVSTSRSVETNSTICTAPSTPGSIKSGMKTKQKFSIQAIKDYIKAGIAEGKRRAKKYMCKALSFGVDTGYLIPTDSDGQVLRVSSALISFTPQNDEGKNGERGLRQKLRKGDATCTSEERKLLRRRGDPIPQKRVRSPSSARSSNSSTKRSTRPKTKRPKYGKRIKKHRTRSSKKVKLKRVPRRPRSRINWAKIKEEDSLSSLKPENRDENNRVGKENLQEETLTPSRSEEDNSKSIKKANLSDPSIEEDSSEGMAAKGK